MDDLREEVARARFARWQQILWEDGAQTITWDELTRSEQVMEMDCADAAIAIVLDRAAGVAEQSDVDPSRAGTAHRKIAKAIRAISND